MLTWLWRPCASRATRSCGHVASWCPIFHYKHKDVDEEVQEIEPRFVIIHAGGAIMRNGPGIRSAEVGVLHRGEVVTVLKDSGKRACIRTREGIRAWISTITRDNVPIVRRVTLGTEMQELPSVGASQKSNAVFADDFERKWQEKWQRVHANAEDSHEAKPLSLRQGTPGMQINAWRPSGKPDEKAVVLPASMRRRREDKENQSIPRLEAPPAPTSELAAPSSERTPAKPSVAAGEDLLDLEDTFETWPRAVARAAQDGGRKGIPSLVELFSTQSKVQKADAESTWGDAESSATNTLGDAAAVGTSQAFRIAATPEAAPTSRENIDGAIRSSRLYDQPPSRGTGVDTRAVEDMITADKFDYLLKDFPDALMRQVDKDVDELPPSTFSMSASPSATHQGVDYDAHADFSSDDDAVGEITKEAILGDSTVTTAELVPASRAEVPATDPTDHEAASQQVAAPDDVGESAQVVSTAHDSEKALRVLMETYSDDVREEVPTQKAEDVLMAARRVGDDDNPALLDLQAGHGTPAKVPEGPLRGAASEDEDDGRAHGGTV